jgi:Cu/Ag efflux protein CusF
MKTSSLAFILAISVLTGTTQAAAQDHDMSQHQMTMQSAAEPARHEGIGVLRTANEKEGKVQIAHESIVDLGWPAMNMWFALNCPLPEDIRVGDTVRFELAQDERNRWTIVAINRK